MRKLLTLMLCGMTILSLVACSKTSSEDDVRGEQIVKEASTDKNPSTEEVTNTSNEAVSVTDNEETEDKSFSMGKSAGLIYENAFIGLGCTLEEGWSFYTDEQIKQLNNFATDAAGEDFEELINNAPIIYDMLAVDANQMNNINVNLEKVDQSVLSSVNLNDVFSQNLPMLEEALDNMGYVNVQSKLITVTIDGEDFSAINTSGEINGLGMYQKSIGVKCNGYLATITVTTYGEDTTNDILANFYVIE